MLINNLQTIFAKWVRNGSGRHGMILAGESIAGAATSQKVTGMSVAMPTTQPLELTYLRPDASTEPASMALVPVAASSQWAPIFSRTLWHVPT